MHIHQIWQESSLWGSSR